MAVKDIPVKMEEKSYDFSQHLVKFVAALSQALKDGWQPLGDMPALISASISDLVPALQEVQAVTQESKDNLPAFLKAQAVSSVDLAVVIGVL